MLNVKKLLTKITGSLASLVVFKDYSYSYTLGSQTTLTITAANLGFSTPTGYTPLGVLTVDSGHVAVELERVSGYLDNRIRNVSGSSQSGTYTMRVAYVKNIGGGYSLAAFFSRLIERRWDYVERKEGSHKTDKRTDCFGDHRLACFVHNRNGKHLDEARKLHDTEKRIVSVQSAVHQFCRYWHRVFKHVCDFGRFCNDYRKHICRGYRRDVVDGCRNVLALDEVFNGEQVEQCKDLRRSRSIVLERGCSYA